MTEVADLIRANKRLKVQGTRHSFNTVADGDGVLLSLDQMRKISDPASGTVKVEGGVDYGLLASHLEARGFALANLASLPHISVAGACSTATHGSGVGNGNLATSVEAITFVDGTGEIRELSRAHDPEVFPGAVVALGALGVVTETTLHVEPSFQVAQTIYCDLTLEALAANFDAIRSSAYSVSLFTTWADPKIEQVWVKRRLDTKEPAPKNLLGATASAVKLHPLAGLDPINCTEQLGVPGPWHERLPHFRMDFTPSSGDELQSEFFVPAEHGLEAVLAISSIGHLVSPLLHVSEIRFIAADDLWLSPQYGAEKVGIHFTWKKDWEGVKAVLPKVEAALDRFGATPHWGKLFTMPAQTLRSRHPRLGDFQRLIGRFDPERKFANQFLCDYVYAN